MSNGLLLKLVTNSSFTKKENHWVIPCQMEMIKRLPCDPSRISSFLEIWFISMRNENENLRSFAQLVLKILLFENWQVRQIFWLRWGKWDMDFWIMDNKDSYYDLVKLAKLVMSSMLYNPEPLICILKVQIAINISIVVPHTQIT